MATAATCSHQPKTLLRNSGKEEHHHGHLAKGDASPLGEEPPGASSPGEEHLHHGNTMVDQSRPAGQNKSLDL